MNKPKITVIMAVYNCEDTVGEAIDSILNQTFQDFEFIICDDCSTDNTYQILRDYEKRFPDKVVIIQNEKNSKLAYGLNHCLKYAKGKYIARMDGDDISDLNRLQVQYDFLINNTEYDLVGTSVTLFDENGKRGVITKKTVPNKYDLLKKITFNHASILMTKSAFERVGYYTDLPRTVRCEDVDLWFKFFATGLKGYNIQESYYNVRLSINDFSRRTFQSRLNGTKTRLKGFHLLKIPFYYYPLALRPIMVGLIPHKVMFHYHKYVQMKSQKNLNN